MGAVHQLMLTHGIEGTRARAATKIERVTPWMWRMEHKG
jgi:hypothetical protein